MIKVMEHALKGRQKPWSLLISIGSQHLFRTSRCVDSSTKAVVNGGMVILKRGSA